VLSSPNSIERKGATTANNNNLQQPTTTANNRQQPPTTANNRQQPPTTANNRQQPPPTTTTTTANNNNNNNNHTAMIQQQHNNHATMIQGQHTILKQYDNGQNPSGGKINNGQTRKSLILVFNLNAWLVRRISISDNSFILLCLADLSQYQICSSSRERQTGRKHILVVITPTSHQGEWVEQCKRSSKDQISKGQ
jgi:hypothetical protein